MEVLVLIVAVIGIGYWFSTLLKQEREAREEKERIRWERECAKQEKERQRLQKKRDAENARRVRERERLEKAAALQRKRDEAEQSFIDLALESLDDRYGAALERHEELTDCLAGESDPEKVIEYCKEDVCIIPMLFDYATRKSLIEKKACVYPQPNTYLTLSEAYEKLRRYDYAILACQQALEMGIDSAGQYGTMKERIDTLIKQKHEVRHNGEM